MCSEVKKDGCQLSGRKSTEACGCSLSDHELDSVAGGRDGDIVTMACTDCEWSYTGESGKAQSEANSHRNSTGHMVIPMG